MFSLLKSKLASFISGLAGRQEKKAQESQELKTPPPSPQPIPAPVKEQKQEAAQPATAPQASAQPAEAQVSRKPESPQPSSAKPSPQKTEEQKKQISLSPKQQPEEHVDVSSLGKKASSEKRELAPKIGLGAAIRSFFTNEITIGESDISDLLENLELSLLEADVAYDVSLEVASRLRSCLVGMRVPKSQLASRTKEQIQQVLESVMQSERRFDLVSKVKSLPKPVKILFVGPNGAGKTTTMAKVAKLLSDAGLSVMFSASDTFRAAAIEQAEEHAKRLGIGIVKGKYGADPASVAFDAIAYARSRSIDVVLIDSAGRQDTNANLLAELKKISRVAKPDLKIYVGESIGGNAVIEQIKAFNQAIGMDGAILTKLDCDAKGGTAISIVHSTGIPLLYLGVGQGYSDLIPFEPRKIAQEIMT
ncbi:MAG: signal recognition particle-docking protein FtsY [Candidatus Micrarchaeota archaeon]|nr:signal recognition particle-docking protein FtsY [Candidatus Micrarchaeota archaeon]